MKLTGPAGLPGDVIKRVLEAALEGEMDGHLGYTNMTSDGRNGGNSRNGVRTKTVITEVGPVVDEVPRDREGTFEPTIVRKRQRRNQWPPRHVRRCSDRPGRGHGCL